MVTSQRSIRAGSELGRLGFGLGQSRQGQAGHVARCDAATSRPWALIGLRPQRGSHRVAHGGPALMVHGPTAGRMVDQVHRLFSFARLTCTELTHGWSARGCSPVFFRGGAPVGGERPVSLRGSAGVRLERGKLPRATVIMILWSNWWSRSSSALATAAGGSAVLAGGEVAHIGSPVAKLGR